MIKLTLPTNEQLFGDNKLDIIKKRGREAVITDFAILLGGYVIADFCFLIRGKKLIQRTGEYWTKSDAGLNLIKTDDNEINNAVSIVNKDGNKEICSAEKRITGARPILPYSLIRDIPLKKTIGTDGVLEVEYGEYPQWVPSRDYQIKLEHEFKKGTITKLTNYITTDSLRWTEFDKKFEQQQHQIYEYNKKKYIRIKANTHPLFFKLSDGIDHMNGDYIWVEISPVKWLVDEKENIMLTENIIFAGVQFDQFIRKTDYITSNFHETNIYWFMNTYLIKDLFQINNTNYKTTEQLLEEILRLQLKEALKRNKELEQEISSYKQRIKRINDITKE